MKIVATSNAGCHVYQEADCYVGDKLVNQTDVSYRVTSGHAAYGAGVLAQGDDAEIVGGRILLPKRITGLPSEPVMLTIYWEENGLDRWLTIKTHLTSSMTLNLWEVK